MNDKTSLIDVTEVVQNSLKLLFDTGLRRRLLKPNEISAFLAHRWTVDEGDRPTEPFWLVAPGAREPVELSELVGYLLTGVLPSHWSIRRNAITSPMTFGERSQLFQAFSQAASLWNMERGRLHQGLDEILAIFSALARAVGDGRHFAPGDVELTWQVLERLIDDLCGFPFASDDLNTVLDVGRALELWTKFALKLPRNLPLNSIPLIDSLFKLARFARELMMDDLDTSHEFTDLIDGALLPWSRVAEELLPSSEPPLSLSIALARYGRGASVRQRIRVAAMSTFALDFDPSLGAPVDTPVEQVKGPYSFATAAETGAELSGILATLTDRRRHEAATPLASWPQVEWTDTQPQRFRELELS